MTWWDEVWQRLQPDQVPAGEVSPVLGWAVVAAVALAVVVPVLWRMLRVLVTVVHELGHGLVGVLVGRRFTGLVLRGDMSGHAVTVGPARGFGRVASTWAGYPAPAVLGAALANLAAAGWAPPVLGALTAVLLGSLVRVRSLYTAAVMVGVTAATGALWWWGGTLPRAEVLAGVGLFLVVGAWRHLGALTRRPSRASDPGVLAELTRVPAFLWLVSFVVVVGVSSWWALGPLRRLAGF